MAAPHRKPDSRPEAPIGRSVGRFWSYLAFILFMVIALLWLAPRAHP